MGTSTAVMMAAVGIGLVVAYWKSPQAAGVSRFFPFLAGQLSEMVWERIRS